jgi:hypothetical protein
MSYFCNGHGGMKGVELPEARSICAAKGSGGTIEV